MPTEFPSTPYERENLDAIVYAAKRLVALSKRQDCPIEETVDEFADWMDTGSYEY